MKINKELEAGESKKILDGGLDSRYFIASNGWPLGFARLGSHLGRKHPSKKFLSNLERTACV
jgi:hypothetical protein